MQRAKSLAFCILLQAFGMPSEAFAGAPGTELLVSGNIFHNVTWRSPLALQAFARKWKNLKVEG